MDKYQLDIPVPKHGINYLDDSLIGDHEAAEGTINVSFKDGVPKTRKGYVPQTLYEHTGEGYDITMLDVHYVAGEKRLLFASNSHLYQMNEDKTPVRRDLGSISSGAPAVLPVPCALTGYAYSEKAFVMDGAALKFFDETNGLTAVPAYTPTTEETSAYGTNVLSTTPAEINGMKWLLNDDNRIWAAGYGNLVRISHLGAAGPMPDYWPSTQAIRLPEDCTGMVRYMGDVMLFTKNTAALVSGSTPVITMDDAYQNIQLPGEYGCERQETIALGDNSVYWANRNGVYRYTYQPTGFSIPECVSEFTVPHSDGTSHTRTVKKRLDAISDWTKVWAVFYDHEYRLYLGGNEVLVFDTINNSWALYRYADDFLCGTTYMDTLLYGAKKPTGANAFIYEMDYTYVFGDIAYKGLSDNGTAFTTTLKSKFFDFGKAANKKRFKKFFFTLYSEYLSYDLTVTVNVDNEDFSYEGDIYNKVSIWGSDDPITDPDPEAGYTFCFDDVINEGHTNLNYPVRVRHRGKRYNVQYTLESADLNHAWTLLEAVLLFKMKELK